MQKEYEDEELDERLRILTARYGVNAELITKIHKFDFQPGNMIIVTFRDYPTYEEVDEMQKHLRRIFTPLPVILIPEGVNITLLSDEDLRRLGLMRLPSAFTITPVFPTF